MHNREEHNEDNHSREENFDDNASTAYPKVSNQTVDEITKMTFDSLEAAEFFYREYSKQMGFSFRVRDSQVNKKDQPRMKKWVCEKEGTKKTIDLNEPQQNRRRNHGEIRQNCPASFHVKLDRKTKQWVVKKFVPMHNHDLALPKHVQFLKSHRSIDIGEMAQAKAMHEVGVKTSKIIDLLAHQSGGFQNLEFIPKDMYNNMNVEKKREIQDGDAFTTLGFLGAKKESDPGFFFKYTSRENGQLCNLFWSDSLSRLDYSIFGDVIAFDACYKRNIYCTPIVTLMGLNNHRQSIVFACALLEDEQTSSYIWVLNTFLECMGAKKPFSVVTDGDLAMRAAIREVFPDVAHRLCSWHIQRNATSEVKNVDFHRDFQNLLLNHMELNEFETKWTSLVSKYNLENNSWIQRMYEDRKMWAETYFKGVFLGGTRTTSRCEGFHSFLNDFVNKKLNLFEFVKQFDRALDKIRYNENRADHSASYSNPTCNHVLKVYEKQAAEKYTPKALMKFQEELNQESAYLMAEPVEYNENEHIYQLSRWRSTAPKRTVRYNSFLQTIKCSCMHFESWGFPCRHSICVIKLEELSCIPESCFLRRWTKNAKNNFLDTADNSVIPDDVLSMIRYGALTSTCKRMCQLASRSTKSFKEVTNEVTKVVSRLEEENHLHMHIEQFEGIRDPKLVRTKGMRSNNTSKPTTARKCGKCRTPGHTRTTCPLPIGVDHTVVASNNESEDIISTDSVLRKQSTQDAMMISSKNMMSNYASTGVQNKEVMSRFDIGGTSKEFDDNLEMVKEEPII
ncbi:FAR1-related sequence 9 [Euphorbia peplus]|nr:FAR1-related sequence 9 [Euphorbia peplus]